jgi:hypothetical protein
VLVKDDDGVHETKGEEERASEVKLLEADEGKGDEDRDTTQEGHDAAGSETLEDEQKHDDEAGADQHEEDDARKADDDEDREAQGDDAASEPDDDAGHEQEHDEDVRHTEDEEEHDQDVRHTEDEEEHDQDVRHTEDEQEHDQDVRHTEDAQEQQPESETIQESKVDLWVCVTDNDNKVVVVRSGEHIEEFEFDMGKSPGIQIIFHEDSKLEDGLDKLEFFKSSSYDTIDLIGKAYTGSDLPGDPIKLRMSKIYVRLTRRSAFAWGIRTAAAPAVIPRDPWDKYMVLGKYKIIESPHEYDNSQDSYEDVHIEGADSVTVMFDPRSATELNYDYIQFKHNKESSNYYGVEKYTGKQVVLSMQQAYLCVRRARRQ